MLSLMMEERLCTVSRYEHVFVMFHDHRMNTNEGEIEQMEGR